MAGIVYVVVTNDEFELTVFTADTCREVAEWLGKPNANCMASALSRSKTGEVKVKGKPFRYMRLDPDTGKVYVGKLPSNIAGQLASRGVKGKRGPKAQAVAAFYGDKESFFSSVTKASKKMHVHTASIYNAIRYGTKCAGLYWRYV